MEQNNNKKNVAVSGGFDPIHVGHVRLFEEAKKLGDHLTVILNGDDWLLRKKGFIFMPAEERAEVIRGLDSVDEVYVLNSTRDDVSEALALLPVHIFANGGDRKNESDIPESAVCREKDIEMIFNVGGGKSQSSSWLINNYLQKARENKEAIERYLLKNGGRIAGDGSGVDIRPWGQFTNMLSGHGWHSKIIEIRPQSRLSLQSHARRSEFWIVVEGRVRYFIDGAEEWLSVGETAFVPLGAKHRLASDVGGKVLEVCFGHFDENDIVRYEDDYGRVEMP